jgi:hypothetical protein
VAVDLFTAGSGLTLNVYLVDTSGQWWNGSAFEAFAGGNFSNYDVPSTEFGTTGVYQYTIPATLPAGVYGVVVKRQAGGAPAQGDLNENVGQLGWSGSAVIVPVNAAAALAAAVAALTTTISEGYRGTNAEGSVRDLLYELRGHLGDADISGTVKSVRKLDGTAAKTYSLNSATAPTAVSEAS